jgi:hypothetical protein
MVMETCDHSRLLGLCTAREPEHRTMETCDCSRLLTIGGDG